MMLFIPELFHHEKITNPQVPTFDSYKKNKTHRVPGKCLDMYLHLFLLHNLKLKVKTTANQKEQNISHQTKTTTKQTATSFSGQLIFTQV